MEKQQSEFSLAYFFKYALRYVLVAVLCAAIGLGAGAWAASSVTVSTPQSFTGALRFDATAYAAAIAPQGNISEGEYLYYMRHLAQATEVARAPEVAAKTFDAQKASLYNSALSDQDKQNNFTRDFVINGLTDGVQVVFTYDVQTEADKQAAINAVTAYLTYAKENVTSKYPEFTQELLANVIVISSVEQGISLENRTPVGEEAPSVLLYALIGAVVGGIFGVAIIFALYLLEPRIKTLTDLLPVESATAVDADEDVGIANFAALMKASGAKALMLAAPVKDAAFGEWTDKLSDYLAKAGMQVKKVTFEAGNSSWLSYFDKEQESADVMLCLCDNTELGVLSYVGKNTDAAALFVDHKAVKQGTLRAALDAMRGCNYIGTVLHNKGRSYLD